MLGLFAVRIIGRTLAAERLAEMRRLRAVRAGRHVGEVHANHLCMAGAGLDQAQLGVGLIGQQFRLAQVGAPAVIVGQIDNVASEEGICGDDFGCEAAGHGADS